MSSSPDKCPNVLSIAGHDPTGGAGIQADIESILANQCRPLSLVTCLTAQNKHGLKQILPQDADNFRLQLELLEQELSIDAVKIGIIGSCELLKTIIHWLDNNQTIPVVFDPVLTSSSGGRFAEQELIEIMKALFPGTTLITPNSLEARQLSGKESLLEAAEILHKQGCENILITGSHEEGEDVIHTLYREDNDPIKFTFERLNGEYHGSGCTLSSAIAAQLALGNTLESATEKALQYTWNSLLSSTLDEFGHAIPKRLG